MKLNITAMTFVNMIRPGQLVLEISGKYIYNRPILIF